MLAVNTIALLCAITGVSALTGSVESASTAQRNFRPVHSGPSENQKPDVFVVPGDKKNKTNPAARTIA
ncbi:MAG: hypothetical protein K2W95_28585 [Candidatus Obscuribacterales bacterium]|nr:hypothetical protein [Candidatus Obscuribacterales bacterium]